MSEFSLVLPEIFLLSMLCVVLLIDLYLPKSLKDVTYWLTQVALLGTAILAFPLFSVEETTLFSGTLVIDKLAVLLKIAVCLVSFCALVYGKSYIRVRNILSGEYYALTLSAVLGMLVLVSSASFLTLYLGLELLSLSLYALVSIRRDSNVVAEAAMKYFVMGALASGLMVYGISMIYGATQSLQFIEVAKVAQDSNNFILLFGMIFIIAGLAFKLGSVPFHMWVPDVYHGAPSSVTQFIGTAPKIAVYGMAIRILADAFPALAIEWQDILIVLAVLSIAVGNVIAISQTNLKRMLAYSAIAHIGYFLLGLLSSSPEGYSASLFYIISYAIMTLGAFGAIVLLSREGFEADEINDFKGLASTNLWYAGLIAILMFSMAGVPPMLGFYAKLSVLKAVIASDLAWVAVVAVFFAIIGAFYYLRVIKVMFFDAPAEEGFVFPTKPFSMHAIFNLNALLILALGLFPASLMVLCYQIF